MLCNMLHQDKLFQTCNKCQALLDLPVLSMMTLKARMKAVSALGKMLGFCRQYLSANFSIILLCWR
jgi:hypothetical protein